MTLYFPQLKYSINVIGGGAEPEPETPDTVILDGTIDANGNLATDSSKVTLTFGQAIPIQTFTLHLSCNFFRYGSNTYYLPCQLLLSEEINSTSGDRPQPQLNFTIANEHMGLYVGTWASGNGYEFNPNLRGNYQYSPMEYTINVSFAEYSDTHYKIALPTGTYNYTEGNHTYPPEAVTYSQVGDLVLVPKTCKITGFNLQNFNYSRLRTNVNNSYVEIAGKKHYAIPA